MSTFIVWTLAGLVAISYCVAKAVIDLRAGRYVWSALGFGSAIVLAMMPVQTHSVTIDLPAAAE